MKTNSDLNVNINDNINQVCRKYIQGGSKNNPSGVCRNIVKYGPTNRFLKIISVAHLVINLQ